ncbi:MAG: FAD-dependent oxidoreductase [Deltaproteobacteria bacterium]|nr:FAD-dependent oxidoreductase [Deltaproteobacteria bacterium]
MSKQVKLTIDGNQISVNADKTILEAARELGKEIPTLCYIKRFDPYASCFMCVVEVEGSSNLLPSCSTKVMDGMKVKTQSAKIDEARKAALELLFSDHIGDCFAPCHVECPTGIDIPGFINEISRDNPEKSIEIIKRSLPFPACLGRVCPAPCESGCRRTLVEDPVSIMNLKRYAADVDLKKPVEERYLPKKQDSTGKKIAVIGAGPSGLAVAYFTQLMGHHAVVFESHAAPGGMIRYGIPSFRLPGSVIDEEVKIIERLGVEFHYNKTVGENIKFGDLIEEYDAVFVGIGAQNASSMRVEGEDAKGVISAIEFLEKVETGEIDNISKKVMVVGGGNSAIDAARTAIRLGVEESGIYYRRSRKEMPAWEFEIKEAEADGVQLNLLTSPTRIEHKNGKVHVNMVKMKLGEPDASGRRRPLPIEGSEYEVVVDTVISAIGQKVSNTGFENSEINLTRWGSIIVDEKTMATNIEGVFSGGDAVLGPDIAVRAAGMGKMAAVSIDQYLRGQEVRGLPELYRVTIGPLDSIPKIVYEKYEKEAPIPMPHLKPSQANSDFREVTLGYSSEQAKKESERCMECGCRGVDKCKFRSYADIWQPESKRFQYGEIRDIYIDDSHPDIVFESNKCITCGNCVRICELDKKCYALAFEKRGFNTVIRPPMKKKLVETSCDGCGKCVEECPTGALVYSTAKISTDLINKNIIKN